MIDNPRLELLLAKQGRAIAIALVVVGILAIGATGWAVANPETTTTPQFDEERVSTEGQTSAIVVQDGPLWSDGDELTDSSVYFLNTTPELTVEPETTLRNETGGAAIEDANVTHELTLRFDAVRDGAVFWNESHQLLRESPSVENGVATSETTLDIESYRQRQRQLQREVSGVGTVELTLELRVEYDTGRHQGTLTTTTPVAITEDAYWLEESLSDSASHSHRSGTIRTTESRSPALIGGLSVLGTLSLVAGAIVARRSPTDIEAARRAVHEQRYAEWISRGSIPMWIGDYHVSLDTLEDVVDVAIDTNERVVHDHQRGLFAVVSDGVVYYYSDRGLWEETAWPEMDLQDQSAVVDADGELPTGDVSELDGIDEFADADDPDGFEDDEEVWEQL
ncbi:DUF5305 domain-containing protein [Natrinema longum]|uniref:DUF5305 domain-containing protein n=1 Tax=Natrinema longum TaxID=370324 RepID=A0A8A2U8J8_9EURY|nr:DUF5305 domain-containing protein [Natrinema longum]MBZ6494409.1 DUF5305 domain-containing protein [Natrinema longum]QSW84268.1 DUF5305 domain-containing protein [Natrinema longum]